MCSSWVKPSTVIANTLVTRIVCFRNLDTCSRLNSCNNCYVAITTIVPTSDSTNLWLTTSTESSCCSTCCPLTSITPVVSSPRCKNFSTPSTLTYWIVFPAELYDVRATGVVATVLFVAGVATVACG